MNLKKWNKREKKKRQKKWRRRNRAIFARIGEKCEPRQLSLAETRVKFSVVLKPWQGEWSEAQDEWKSRFRSLFQAVASRQNAPVDPVRANSSDVWQKKMKKERNTVVRQNGTGSSYRFVRLWNRGSLCPIASFHASFSLFLSSTRYLYLDTLISWYFSYGIRPTQPTVLQVKEGLIGGFVNEKNISRNISIFIASVSTRLVFLNFDQLKCRRCHLLFVKWSDF